MANGSGDFSQEDVKNWAGNRGDGGGDPNAADAGDGDEADAAAGGASTDPCDVLKDIGKTLGEQISKMEGLTLPDDEDEKFSDVWEEALEDMKALEEKVNDAVEAREELEDDDEDEDEDAEKGADDGDAEEGADKDKGGDGGDGK